MSISALEARRGHLLAGRSIKPSPGPRPRFRDCDQEARALDMNGQCAKVKVPVCNVGGW
ncbi:MAG: hypothetical protein SGI92_22295 [Bryobacteraceae bacterium]|nr:hypothetical protein [Bryobacteraceae bacterium]